MISTSTFTLSLRFTDADGSLAMQAQACTPTKTLNGTQTAITSGTFEQQWGPDATGNWNGFNMEATERLAKMNAEGGRELLNGTWGLSQTRTANKVIEITGITNSVGTAWATPTYDPARNMAGIPNPQLLTAQYDAWNRMVRITDGATTICENVDDARTAVCVSRCGDLVIYSLASSATCLVTVMKNVAAAAWQLASVRRWILHSS